MNRCTRFVALTTATAIALAVGACANAPPIPFRFEYSPAHIERVSPADRNARY